MLKNPVHIFTDPGTYTITLTIKDSNGSDIKTSHNYIFAAHPQANIINGDSRVDLEDTMIILNTLADEPASLMIRTDILPDINKNGKTGVKEAIYVLKWFSSM